VAFLIDVLRLGEHHRFFKKKILQRVSIRRKASYRRVLKGRGGARLSRGTVCGRLLGTSLQNYEVHVRPKLVLDFVVD
jgi:hypothetical protein